MTCKKISTVLLSAFIFSLGGCADDIRGESGPAGDPGRVGDPGADLTAQDYLRLARPTFACDPDDINRIRVEGAESRPARIVIGETLHVNRKDALLDITESGLHGLDRGIRRPDTIYYVYAVPGGGEGEFDLVASAHGPTVGPADYPLWSYLGAFATDEAGAVRSFARDDGWLLFHAQGEDFARGPLLLEGGQALEWTVVNLPAPDTAELVLVTSLALLANEDTDGQAVLYSIDGGATVFTEHSFSNRGRHSVGAFREFWIPVTGAGYHYRWFEEPRPTWTVENRLAGWRENPTTWP